MKTLILLLIVKVTYGQFFAPSLTTIKLPFKVNLESFIECKDHNKLESMLHNLLSHKRIDGEWFDLNETDFNEIDLVIKNMGLVRSKTESNG